MTRIKRIILAGSLLVLGGCGNTGGGMPQMLELTKPRMDKQVETDRPAPKAVEAEAFGSH